MSRQLIQVEKKQWTQAEIEQGERERKEFMKKILIPFNKDPRVVQLIIKYQKNPIQILDGQQVRRALRLKLI